MWDMLGWENGDTRLLASCGLSYSINPCATGSAASSWDTGFVLTGSLLCQETHVATKPRGWTKEHKPLPRCQQPRTLLCSLRVYTAESARSS